MRFSNRLAGFVGLVSLCFGLNAHAAHLGHGFFKASSTDMPAAGYLSIDNDAGPMVVTFDKTFSVVAGNDLRVLMHDQAAPVDFSSGHYMDLGALTNAAGEQEYVIPAGTQLKQFKSIVIYSPSSAMKYGEAKLAIHVFE